MALGVPVLVLEALQRLMYEHIRDTPWKLHERTLMGAPAWPHFRVPVHCWRNFLEMAEQLISE
jgi:hypothetical protein